jgi:hypothetical protein
MAVPIHDWTIVDAGIFHHFHQRWISALTDVLNERLLPQEYYALAEQQSGGFESDILTLKASGAPDPEGDAEYPGGADAKDQGGGNGQQRREVMVADPPISLTATTDLDFYRRKQNVVAIRHISGDQLVAIVEIISKGNKSGRKAFDDLVRKAADLLFHQVHLLIVDLQPPTARDPNGIHGAIWEDVAGEVYSRPTEKALTLAAYESGTGVRAFIEPIAVGDKLVEMPVFLDPGRYVAVPLEETYQAAFAAVPRRWRTVLEPGISQ